MAVYFTTTGILIPHLTGSQESGMARHSAATAVILMLCAAVFDLFDGLVARKLRSPPMGAELDNLSDLISSGSPPRTSCSSTAWSPTTRTSGWRRWARSWCCWRWC